MCSASEFHNLIVEGKNELEYEVVRQKIGTKLCGKKCLENLTVSKATAFWLLLCQPACSCAAAKNTL